MPTVPQIASVQQVHSGSLSLFPLFLSLLSFSLCLSISHPLSPRNISPLIVLSAHSYSNIDTSSIGRRGLSRGSFRAPRDIIESPDDNGARGRQWRSSCSSEVFRNRRGANNTGRALLSFSRCIGDEASTIPLRPIAQRRREGNRECWAEPQKRGEIGRKKLASWDSLRILMRGKPLSESSAVVTIKSYFLREIAREGPGDLRARSAKPFCLSANK